MIKTVSKEFLQVLSNAIECKIKKIWNGEIQILSLTKHGLRCESYFPVNCPELEIDEVISPKE